MNYVRQLSYVSLFVVASFAGAQAVTVDEVMQQLNAVNNDVFANISDDAAATPVAETVVAALNAVVENVKQAQAAGNLVAVAEANKITIEAVKQAVAAKVAAIVTATPAFDAYFNAKRGYISGNDGVAMQVYQELDALVKPVAPAVQAQAAQPAAQAEKPSKWSYLNPRSWLSKKQPTQDAAPAHEAGNSVDFGVFKDVVAALNAINTADQEQKVVQLQALRAQAEAINGLVQAADYAADAQRASLVQAVTLLVAQFKQVFASEQAAIDFMTTKDVADQVKASVFAIRSYVAKRANIKEALAEQRQAALGDSEALFDAIYTVADQKSS